MKTVAAVFKHETAQNRVVEDQGMGLGDQQILQVVEGIDLGEQQMLKSSWEDVGLEELHGV